MLKWIEKFKPITRFRIALVAALLGVAPVMWTASAALVPGGSGDTATVLVFIAAMVLEWFALTVCFHAAQLLGRANAQLKSIMDDVVAEAPPGDRVELEGEWLPSDEVDWLNPGDLLCNTQSGIVYEQPHRSRNELASCWRIKRAVDPQMPEVLYSDPVQVFGMPVRVDPDADPSIVKIIGDYNGADVIYVPSPVKRAGGRHRPRVQPPDEKPEETTEQLRLFTHGDLFSNGGPDPMDFIRPTT